MSLKPKKLRRISNNTKRAPTASRGEADAVAISPSVLEMPGSDLQLAWMLLNGFVEEGRQGTLRTKYLEEGYPLELQARTAIARLLRSKAPLDAQLREHLADLFDPIPAAWRPRRIKFVFRRPGTATDQTRNTQIAQDVGAQVKRGVRVTKAITNAANRFALSEDTIKKIWHNYRRRYIAYLGI
jgi:hypothetical protein